jgi:hypothetical protein
MCVCHVPDAMSRTSYLTRSRTVKWFICRLRCLDCGTLFFSDRMSYLTRYARTLMKVLCFISLETAATADKKARISDISFRHNDLLFLRKLWNNNLYSPCTCGSTEISAFKATIRFSRKLFWISSYRSLNFAITYKWTATNNGNIDVAIFWDIAPCSRYVYRRFGGTYHVHLQGRKSVEKNTGLAKSDWFSFLKMEVILSSGTLVLIRATRRYNPENGNIQNYCCKNLKYCSGNIRSWTKIELDPLVLCASS